MSMRAVDFMPLDEAQRVTRDMELEAWKDNASYYKESLAELELALEDEGWQRLGVEGEREFSRTGLDKIISLARVMYLKNPLIQRAVEIRAFYVWGQGVEIQARGDNEALNKVVQSFLNNVGNRREFTGHAARVMKEKKLQSEGNIFFSLFTNRLNGIVKLRSIPTQEVRDIIYNPDDRNEVWFYVREWVEKRFNVETGEYKVRNRKAYYPDINFNPKEKPSKIRKYEVKWDAPVYHVRVGGFDDMRFGVPETYAALDWARAYKGFLEDWATLVKAISRFAWKVTKKRKGQIAGAKRKLETTVSRETGETNPPNTAGAYWLEDENTTLAPINKSGATTSAEDGKMLRLMVASAMHLPDTILSNDPQQGALATAKTLDRPTELAMVDRQQMWIGVLTDLLNYVVLARANAVNGGLSGVTVVENEEEEQEVVVMDDGTPVEFDITFPPVIEYDLPELIGAIVKAMTLDGKAPANIAPLKLFRRLILSAFNVKDIDDILDEMEELDDEEPPPTDVPPQESIKDFVKELRDLREALVAA